MLPETIDVLDANYPAHERDALWRLIEALREAPAEERVREGRKFLRHMWPDDLEYLQKTSWIQRKQDMPCLLTLNFAQLRFWQDVVIRCREEHRPLRAIILKARQLGFSTLVEALHYAWASLHPHRNALTISYDDESGQELLAKARFIHENLFFPLPTVYDAKSQIQFKPPHRSSFRVLTAGGKGMGRSYTFHYVHCSEIPFWLNADLVLLGLSQCIPATSLESSSIWESTAQGMVGPFYEGWTEAEAGNSPYIPFFAPWFWNPEYSTSFPSDDHKKRFMRALPHDDLKSMDRYELTEEQMHWRANKIAEPGMTRPKFKQEFPACAQEAFLTSGTPVFDQEALLELQQRAVDPVWRGGVVLERA